MRIVFEVEQSKDKSEPLTPEQRGVIARDIANMPWTLNEIKRRSLIVKKTNTYKSIGFEWWYNAGEVFCSEEIERELNHRQALRKRDYLNINKTLENEEEALAREGLMETSFTYLRRRDEALNRIRESQERRCRKAKAFIHNCNDSIKNEILELAINKGLIEKDEFWRESLPFLTPLMLDEIERIMKRRE